MLPSVTALRRTVAPAALPISVDEAKAHCRVDSADEDAIFASLVAAAVAMIDGEGELGRAMIIQTWAQWVPQSPGCVRLVMGPFQALTSVQYYDAGGVLQTASLGDFETHLSGDFVLCKPKTGAAWPLADDRADAIKITYTAGFGATGAEVPADLRHMLLMLVAFWYQNREAAAEKSLYEAPYAVKALLGLHRVSWYG